MVARSVLRGYLLEEVLAWLLRDSGYQLLVNEDQDPAELIAQGQELRVRGRGTSHQVDVLGELAMTPAFSLPVRLFLEAKFYRTPCGLPVVRNAHGVIHDVNENFVHAPGSSRPRRRYLYAYCLFSTSGFTEDAADYALAQQISLVDLSGPSFDWLRTAVDKAAGKLHLTAEHHGVATFPVAWMRTQLRDRFGTALGETLPAVQTGAVQFANAASDVLTTFHDLLVSHQKVELLLGFPAAPFMLTLATESKSDFLAYAMDHPSHSVRLQRQVGDNEAEWTIRPIDDEDAYRLTFGLPERIESWIAANEQERLSRTRAIKSDFLSSITVYHAGDDGQRVFQLRYEPAALVRP